jgi:hypothetical protein
MELCSDYRDKNVMSLFDMKNIAWLVDNSKKNQIGFVQPKDLIREHGRVKEFEDIEDRVPNKLMRNVE